jgi:hypothetical protein
MNFSLKLLSIVLFALDAGLVCGGPPPRVRTSSLESRWVSASCAAKFFHSLAPPDAIAAETNPNYKSAAATPGEATFGLDALETRSLLISEAVLSIYLV